MAARLAAAVDAVDQALRKSHAMRGWLRGRRWCGESLGARTELAVKDRAVLRETGLEVLVMFLAVAREPNASIPIHLPLSISTARMDPGALELPVGPDRVYVTEAERRESYARAVVEGFQRRQTLGTVAGDTLHFHGDPFGAFASAAPEGEDTSNLLARIRTSEREVVLKSYKLLDPGNREADILGRLSKKAFGHVPRFLGEIALGEGTDRLVLAVVTEHVPSTDAFAWLTEGWAAELGGPAAPDFERASLSFASSLGEATAGLHEALADKHAGTFQTERFTAEDAEAAVKAALANLGDSLRRLAAFARGPDAPLTDLAAAARARVIEGREGIEAALVGLEACVGTAKGVTHADLHLGQVLRASDGDLLFIDFEGEPERAPGERSAKIPFLRDVATMNRSFAYVKHYVWREATRGDATAAWRLLDPKGWTPEDAAIAHRLTAWETAAVERHTRAYLAKSSLHESMPPEDARRAIRGWTMEKALYELRYELKHRPQNIFIPLEGVLALAEPFERVA